MCRGTRELGARYEGAITEASATTNNYEAYLVLPSFGFYQVQSRSPGHYASSLQSSAPRQAGRARQRFCRVSTPTPSNTDFCRVLTPLQCALEMYVPFKKGVLKIIFSRPWKQKYICGDEKIRDHKVPLGSCVLMQGVILALFL